MATVSETGETCKEDEETHHIPTNLYENILQICKRVCRRWLKFISSPRFIQKYLCRSKNRTPILMPMETYMLDYNYSKQILYPPGFSGENSMILGCCDGLISLLATDFPKPKLAVFNPSTGEYGTPTSDHFDHNRIRYSWFGRHPSTGKYILVIRRESRLSSSIVRIQVYEFCCKAIKPWSSCSARMPLLVLPREIGIFLHGVLHWPATDDNKGYIMIVAYNIQKNQILEIPSPATSLGFRAPPFTLEVVDGRLFTISKVGDTFEMWIMKEYGVVESWTKYKTIMGYAQPIYILRPLGYSVDGDDLILDANSRSLSKYNFVNKKITHLKDHSYKCHFAAFVCVESLVSPALIWE